MLRFVRSALLHRASRSGALAAGILVAAVGFTLLTSAVDTGALEVRGSVQRNFRPAYDILVRPADSFTPIERERGLVRANYLSGIYGGISFSQWHEISSLPGVDVAAPVANIGFVMPFTFVPLGINRFLSADPAQVYRLTSTWLANNGTSRYPDSPQYVYFERPDPMVLAKGFGKPGEVLPNGTVAPVCTPFGVHHPTPYSPFALSGGSSLTCFSGRSPGLALSGTDLGRFPSGFVGAATTVFFPVLIAAIDPTQEQRLLDLNGAVVSGRALGEADQPVTTPRLNGGAGLRHLVVPVLASDRTYVDETLNVAVQRLAAPFGPGLISGLTSDDAYDFVTGLAPSRTVGHLQIPASKIYDSLIAQLSQTDPSKVPISYSAYWSAAPVSYASASADRLIPRTVHQESNVYSTYYGGGWAPWENRDLQFRTLTKHSGSTEIVRNEVQLPALQVIGRFDPTLLPGFSALSRVPLESYYPPAATPADPASQKALGGHPLLPTQNLGDYISQPPLLLTNMHGLRPFIDPSRFGLVSDAADPISVIRVRVAGVTGADPTSLARIRTVAELIHQHTGLAVDITAGSSPHPMNISLPAGKFGRPPLSLQELWVQKGVAVRFLRALDTKSLALFVLVLVVCALFLSNAAFASVRARRTEIGTLLTLGWSRGDVFRVILAELGFVGLVAGLVGAAIAGALVSALSLHLSWLRILAVVPTAVLLAVIPGIIPARRAAAGTPLDAIRPPVVEARRARPVRSRTGLAWVNLRRTPGRTVLAASGLVVGVTALSVLLALNAEFSHVLVGTLLGHAVSLQIRAVDFLTVGLVLVLAGLSVADVLYVNIKERAPELVTLRTTGWSAGDLAKLVLSEAAGIGLLGGLAGAALALVISLVLVRGIAVTTVLTWSVVGLTVGFFVALLASVVPAARISAQTPPSVLAEE